MQIELIFQSPKAPKQSIHAESYKELTKCIETVISSRINQLQLCYLDQDNDSITLACQHDFSHMKSSHSENPIKIYIVEHDDGNGHKQIDNPEQIIKKQSAPIESHDEKKQTGIEKNELSSTDKGCQSKIEKQQKEIVEQWGKMEKDEPSDEKRGVQEISQLHQKMEGNTRKIIEKQVLTKLQSNQQYIQQKPRNTNMNKIQHEAKCSTCGIYPILGIRYKCPQCEQFNLCQICEIHDDHEHNLLKMKKIEQKSKINQTSVLSNEGNQLCPSSLSQNKSQLQKKSIINPQTHSSLSLPSQLKRPILPSNAQKLGKKHQNLDNKLTITHKCFKMSKVFGGSLQQYKQFVQKNANMRIDELCKIYISQTSNIKLTAQAQGYVTQQLQKLSFYFNEPCYKFDEIVYQNPLSKLEKLIKLIVDDRNGENKSKVINPYWKEKSKVVDMDKKKKFVQQMISFIGKEKQQQFSNFFDENNDMGLEELNYFYLKQIGQQKSNLDF